MSSFQETFKGEVGNREISCHLKLGIGLLDMGREITSQQARPKSMSNYDGHTGVYNFTCGSLQSLVSCQNSNVGTSL